MTDGIKCSVHNHTAIVVCPPKLSSGSVNVDTLSVRFDRTWDFENVNYFAVFYVTDVNSGVSVELSENNNIYSCTIPSEMLAAAGRFSFAVYAKNGQGSIIKTSTVCNVDVKQGAYTGAPLVINWAEFKSELIEALNERFNAELAETATTEMIISKINELENADTVRAAFITLLNTAAESINDIENAKQLTLLTDSMTAEQLAATINGNFQILGDTTEFYLSVQQVINDTLIRLHPQAEFGFGADYDSTPIAERVRSLATDLKNNYNGLAGGIVDSVTEDGEFSLDSASTNSDIITVINSILGVKGSLITAINNHFDSEISTDSTTAEATTAIAQIPTAQEERASVISAINSATGQTIPLNAVNSAIITALSGLAPPSPYISSTVTDYVQAEDWLTNSSSGGGNALNFVNNYAPAPENGNAAVYYIINISPQNFYREIAVITVAHNINSGNIAGIAWRQNNSTLQLVPANSSSDIFIKAGQTLRVVKFEFEYGKDWSINYDNE